MHKNNTILYTIFGWVALCAGPFAVSFWPAHHITFAIVLRERADNDKTLPNAAASSKLGF